MDRMILDSFLISIITFLQVTLNIADTLQCSGGNIVSVSIQHGINSTGHPQMKARMEHPYNRSNWQIDVDLAYINCEASQYAAKVLSFNLKGLQQLSGPVSFLKPDQVPQLGQNGLPAGYVAPQLGQKGLPAGYAAIEGLGFIRPGTKALTWLEAEAQCSDEGATMALPANVTAAEALANVLDFGVPGHTTASWAWLGANDHQVEGRWVVTKTGVPVHQVSSMVWTPGEPNSKRNENCMVFHKTLASMGDAPCTWKAAFACYIPFQDSK